MPALDPTDKVQLWTWVGSRLPLDVGFIFYETLMRHEVDPQEGTSEGNLIVRLGTMGEGPLRRGVVLDARFLPPWIKLNWRPGEERP